MRFRFTLILLLLNLLLFSSIIYLDKRNAAEKEFDKVNRRILPPGSAVDAEKLVIESDKLESNWMLQRHPETDEWVIVDPIQWPANYYAVNRIINQLELLEWETRFSLKDLRAAGRTLSEYGLNPPHSTITLYMGNQELELAVGEPAEVGNMLYTLSPDGSYVNVVKRGLLDSITLDLEDLRSPGVFDIPLFEVTGLNIQVTQPVNTKVRLIQSNGKWSFESPIQTRANSDLVIATLNSLTGIRLLEFHSSRLADQGLLNPSIRLTLEGNNRRETLLVGNLAGNQPGPPQYFARKNDSPTVFTIAAEIFDLLRNAQETLRDKRIFQFDPESLSSLEITDGQTSASLQKLETGAWQVLGRSKTGQLITWPADLEVTRSMLHMLSLLEAERFIADAPSNADLALYGLSGEQPQRGITLGTTPTQKLLVGSIDPETQLAYAKNQNEPFVYEVPASILKLASPNPLHYRDRTLYQQPEAASIVAVSLTDLETQETILSGTLDAATLEWRLQPDDWTGEEREAALALINQLSAFEVRDYLRNQFEAPVRLDESTTVPWKFRLEAQFYLPGSGQAARDTIELFFSRRLGGTTQLGGSPELDVIFRNTQLFIDQLHTLTFDRLQAPPKEPQLVKPQPGDKLQNEAPAPATDNQPPASKPKATDGEPASDTSVHPQNSQPGNNNGNTPAPKEPTSPKLPTIKESGNPARDPSPAQGPGQTDGPPHTPETEPGGDKTNQEEAPVSGTNAFRQGAQWQQDSEKGESDTNEAEGSPLPLVLPGKDR